MLKGDLVTTPLASVLLELATDSATGCLVIMDVTDEEALVYFKAGLVYSVSVPGSRPQLGAKLVSSGALAPEALAEALEAQRSELQGWRLGELLVHLGYVDQPVVEAFVREQVSEAIWDLLRWSEGRWKFRKNVKAREDVGPPISVAELLERLRERGYEWETISAIVHGPAAIPRLSTRGDSSSETTLDNDAWSMLCKIDGERTVAELAADCGYTLFEAGNVIVSLVQAGLVDIDEDLDVEGSELYGATTLSSALSGELDEAPEFTPDDAAEEDAMSKLARLVHEVAGNSDTDEAAAADATDDATEDDAAADSASDEAVTEADETPVSDDAAADAAAESGRRPLPPPQRASDDYENPMMVSFNRHSGESFASSIARVSGALSEVLGEVPPPELDMEEVAARRRAAAESGDEEWQRRKRLRSAAQAELASAQALVETLRPDNEAGPDAGPSFGDVPKVVADEKDRKRAAAKEAEDAARREAEESARESAEQFARAAAEQAEQEAARQAAEQEAAEEAERVAAEEQAAAAEAEATAAEQLAADIAEAEESAWVEHAEREEADRLAAEAAEHDAEVEAERLAAEEAEREAAELEAERLAAEVAAAEAAEAIARQEAEEEAAREAEREAEREEALEAARREDEAAAATAMLAAFAASSDDDGSAGSAAVTVAADDDEAEDETEYEPAPEELAEAELLEPVSVGGGWSDADSTDTAALLRELSSLGNDDDRGGGNNGGNGDGAAPRSRPNPAADKKAKKKMGLFGR